MVKSRSDIWLSVLEDLGNTCSVSTRDDADYLRHRVSAEGDSFFTVTLPQFAKDLERSLADGFVSRESFVGFRRGTHHVQFLVWEDAPTWKSKKMHWGLPLFLGGFTRRLFMDIDELYREGLLGPLSKQPVIPMCLPSSEEEADQMADAVFAVRQLCLLFSKEKNQAPPAAEKRAVSRYVDVDEELDRPL